MRFLSALLLVVGVACEGFSWWGMKTVAGRTAFDEMDGIIPLAAAPVGLVFIAIAIVVWWRSSRSRSRTSIG